MNGIYLCLLLKEIREKLQGERVEDIMIRYRVLQIVFDRHSLFVSLHPAALGMFLSKSVARGYETVRGVGDIVRSSTIIDVSQDGFMPVLRVIVEKPFPDKQRIEIVVSFYHEAPNLTVVTESWHRSVFARSIQKSPKSSIFDLTEDDILNMDVAQLVGNIEGIDIKMARGIDADNLKLLKAVIKGKKICPKLVTLHPFVISLFPRENAREFSSFNDLFKGAITAFIEDLDKRHSEQEQRLEIRRLKRRIARLKKKLLIPEAVERLRMCGELILANVAKIRKGCESVELFNPYTKEKTDVPLDPVLTPQANAQKYFSRYKKEKRGQPKLLEQIAKLEGDVVSAETRSAREPAEKKKVGKPSQKREPFHKFNLDSGSVILVGKSSHSNDQLTFGHARPGDYFFHARGVEGAHTILRPNIPKKQRPGKDEIRTAAAIAAYFSKAKTQRNVPVSYTQRKYLKKNKKGKPGSVIMMREEVVFVNPGLPD
jgi:predicted ribosome quality control (RQC) complex YloA/Tae2 family protein